jgi:hypothetical protein
LSTTVQIDKRILVLEDEEHLSEVDQDLRTFNLYKQRFANIAAEIEISMCHIFNKDVEKNILFVYLAAKYNFLESILENPQPTTEELLKEKEDFYKTIQDIIDYSPFRIGLQSFIDENYLLDPPATDSKKSNEQLLLNRDHCIDLQKISFCMKFFIPLISDYFSYRNLNDNDYFDIFYLIIKKFNSHRIANKLYKFVSSRVENTSYSDAVIWAYLSSTAKDTKNTTLDIFNKIVILLLYKLSVDKYPVSFIHAGIKNQLQFKFRENIAIKYSPILIHEKDEDGITSYDKFEIELLRIDEGKNILNEVNKVFMMDKLQKHYNVSVTTEEVQALQHLKLDKLKINLTFIFFTQYLGSFDNFHLTKLQFLELLITFKKILETKHCYLLAESLTCEVINEKRKVSISNKDLLEKLRDTQRYNLLYRNYSTILSKLVSKKNDVDPIMKLISIIYFNRWEGMENTEQTKKKMIVELLKVLS